MGIIKISDLKDYWSTNISLNIPFFRSVFPRNRFFQIFGTLHIGIANGTLKKEKIQPFMDIILPNIRSAYVPNQQVVIDESVIAFKGRVSCLQYLKGKPHFWGIMAYVLADSVTGYLFNVSIYYGRETELVRPELPHTSQVVLTLLQGLENKGYDLYLDRFYNSPFLATELSKIGFTVTGKMIY